MLGSWLSTISLGSHFTISKVLQDTGYNTNVGLFHNAVFCSLKLQVCGLKTKALHSDRGNDFVAVRLTVHCGMKDH